MAENKKDKKRITPGMEDELKKEAAREERASGNTTRVTTLSWDEVED